MARFDRAIFYEKIVYLHFGAKVVQLIGTNVQKGWFD